MVASEISVVLENVKQRAPGEDSISYEMMNYVPPNAGRRQMLYQYLRRKGKLQTHIFATSTEQNNGENYATTD